MTKITCEDYDKKLLDSHMQSWSKILNFDNWVTKNYQTSNNTIPLLDSLRKDHNIVQEGTPQRPVCVAIVASNYRISHYISNIIRPIIDMVYEPCNITEDLLSRIEYGVMR